MKTRIENLAAAIKPLVASEQLSREAQTDLFAAKVEFVTTILATVLPLVRAAGSRPVVSHNWGFTQGDELAKWRAIPLSADPKTVGPTVKKDGGIDTVEGSHIFLNELGKLVEFKYMGYPAMQGVTKLSWTTFDNELTIEKFCRESPHSDPEKLLARVESVVATAGSREDATQDARDRASKYRAMTALLR